MTDTAIKGTGNSRTLKTVVNAKTLYPDFDALMDALIGGTFPVDIGSLQSVGYSTKGTDLNKANLLSDTTETSIWGSSGNRTVDNALRQLRSLVATAQNTANTAQSTADSIPVFSTGYYDGDGKETKTLQLGFEAKILIVCGVSDHSSFTIVKPATYTESYEGTYIDKVVWSKTSVSFDSASSYSNKVGSKYYYAAYG